MDVPEAADPAPAEIANPGAAAPLLVIADHAGCAVPEWLVRDGRPLGLAPAVLRRHVGWDIGAGGVARGIAHRLGATAVLAAYSRLVIDPNRALGDMDCVPVRSDGLAIPANARVDDGALQARARAAYWPYHNSVDRELARLMRGGTVPLLVSIHSFTPALMAAGSARPWHVGVMASRDRRLADALLAALATVPGIVSAFNEPYSGVTHGYCLKAHGLAQGLPHAQIEIRQDLVCTVAGEEWWADLLARLLAPIVADRALRRIEHH
jgi:predicted N-formylglutamate amidohydrolase